MGFLAAVAVVLAGAALSKGGLYIGKHEGDTLHLLQMVLRMAAGDWPHLDFVTPIGLFAFLPIVVFLKAGLGVGHAIIWSQALVAAIFFPAIWWVSYSRFRGAWAYAFGASVLVLILALVYGETNRTVSISMHYNRWAWAAAYLVVAVSFLQNNGRKNALADGLVVGLGMAVMAMIKVTYFVGFALPVLVALAGRRAGMTLFWAAMSGILVIILVTLAGGTAFWPAYVSDLLVVSSGQVRQHPGLPLVSVIGAPVYIGGSLILVLSVILLRQAGRALEGLVMLTLVPGLFYVTYQNYGNDPLWLALLGMLLVSVHVPQGMRNALGWDLQKAISMTAVAAFAMATPGIFNLSYSPFRHLRADPATYTPILPGSGVHQDLQTAQVRARRLDGRVALDGAGTPFAAFTDTDTRKDSFEFQGETLPVCSVELGVVAWYSAMAADLNASGLAQGKTVFAADLLSSYWIFGAFLPLPGGAPWYYGGLPGFDAADYVIVPLCPMSTKVRGLILDEITETGATLTEIRRNEMYILYEK